MKKKVEWFLVLNAARARIVRGLPAPGEAARAELVLRASHRRLQEIMSDKPGRSFASGSPGRRSAMAYGADPQREDEVDFLHDVIHLLEAHRRAGDFDTLVVVAAPHMLGLLRAEMPPALSAMVRKEIDKNLAGVFEAALPAILRNELEPE